MEQIICKQLRPDLKPGEAGGRGPQISSAALDHVLRQQLTHDQLLALWIYSIQKRTNK